MFPKVMALKLGQNKAIQLRVSVSRRVHNPGQLKKSISTVLYRNSKDQLDRSDTIIIVYQCLPDWELRI